MEMLHGRNEERIGGKTRPPPQSLFSRTAWKFAGGVEVNGGLLDYIVLRCISGISPVPASTDISARPAPDLSKSDYEALAALRYALRQFLRFSEEAAAEEGLAPQQHQALLAIKGFPGREQITIGELAEKLQVRHHTAVGLVNRLVTERLVVRATATEDRRKVLIALTKRGERVLAKLSSAHREELRRIGPDFRALLDRIAMA
jgi:DNA-binding MarR family transcriptional regulator